MKNGEKRSFHVKNFKIGNTLQFRIGKFEKEERGQHLSENPYSSDQELLLFVISFWANQSISHYVDA